MKVNKCKLILVKDKEYEYETLNCPKDIYDFLKDKLELHKEPEEVVVLLALDYKKKLVGCCDVSHGLIDRTVLSPRDVYKRALVSNARFIVIAHNHPTGSTTPSLEDKKITKKLKDVGELLEIQLLDHIIVGDRNYYSFYEENPELIESIECEEFYSKQYVNKNKNNDERSL